MARIEVTLKCKICTEDFKVYPYRQSKAKFCSYKCFYQWSKGKSLNTGRTQFKKGFKPHNAGDFIYKNCEICKNKFKVINARIKTAKYCSRKCQAIGYHHLYQNKHGANWKDGKKCQNGYILVFKPEHLNSISHGYVFEHRLVMEEYLGRYLETKEVVHHINGIKKDNRLENLELFNSNGEHMKREFAEKGNWLTEARLKK